MTTTPRIKLCPRWTDADYDADKDANGLDHLFQRAGAEDDWLGLFLRGTTTKDGEQIRSSFVASTSDVDRVGDIIEQKSWRLANYRRNPVILYQHWDPVVGRGIVKVDEVPRLLLDVVWDDAEVNPIGMLAAHQHLNGFRNAVSVGFRPGKSVLRSELPADDPRSRPKDEPGASWRGYVFSYCELLEVSSVSVPANAAALQLAHHAQTAEDPVEQVRRLVAESTPEAVADAIMRAVRHSVQLRNLLQATVWSGTTPTKPGPLAHLFGERDNG